MAGSYPDVPGRRMAFDRDGTEGYVITPANTIDFALTNTQMRQLNNEAIGEITNAVTGNKWVFIFPELRDVVGIFMYAGHTAFFANVSTSADTTNGIDGTWTVRLASPTASSVINPYNRTAITSVSWTGVKAIRFDANHTGWNFGLHFYGDPASGQNPNRLRLWHPTLDQEVGGAHFDWGDVARGTVNTKTFRVKNNSATLTAGGVALSSEALTDGTPTNVSAHTFSPDGSTYTSSLSIGTLAPGAISSVVTVKRDTPSGAPLSLWVTRIVASAASWT